MQLCLLLSADNKLRLLYQIIWFQIKPLRIDDVMP